MKKDITKRLIAVMLVVITCLSLVPMTASAATTTPYYLANGNWQRINPRDGEAGTGRTPIYGIYMYGSSSSGTGTLENNACINWDTVTFYMDCDKKVENIPFFRIKYGGTYDDFYYGHENNTGGASRQLWSGSLPDGTYDINVIASYQTVSWIIVYTLHEYSLDYTFTMDRTAPTISGASSSVVYKNTGFTVSTSDATSGIRSFYCCKPGESLLYLQNGTSVTIPAGSANGYYHFKSYDNAGNESEYSYVYYDNVKPTGTIKDSSGNNIAGTYTNKSFSFIASDSGSGIGSRKIWKPSSTVWENYSGSTIYTSSADGTYYFYAADRAGNTTSTMSVTLDATAPTGTLYGGTTVVANGGKIVADYAKFVPTDALSGVKNSYVKKPGSSSYVAYTSGTKLYDKGTYYFYSTDNAGNTSSTYSMTLLDAPVETYTVSYYANGGSGAPATQTKIKDVTLTLASTSPYRTGYTFKGWGTSSSSSTPTYQPSGSYTQNTNITLYAIWEKIPQKYTVSYNANGGTGAPATQTKTEDISLKLSSTKPTRSGYTFVGWSESSGAASASYAVGGYYTKNASTTLYAVWEKDLEQYTVRYNATGGTGAPSSQVKTENVTLTLSSQKPTRSGYDFMGWSESSSATTAEYQPGGSYTKNASATLYAVWEKVNYDFSISNLKATPNEVMQFDTVNVSLRVDSWDQRNAYTDIPIDVLLNGVPVYSTTVDISVYGVKNLSFNLNVGASEGVQNLEARVNWDEHYRETRTENNSVTASFNVKKVIETSVTKTSASGEYVAGQEVVSSFYAVNDGSSGIVPGDGVSFDFEVYTVNANGTKTVVSRQTKNNIVIPGNSTNLVYFKWKVPENGSGTKYYCKGKISESYGEQNTANNATEYAVTAVSNTPSHTPDTRYESNAPSGYNPSAITPSTKSGSASWNEWVYENGEFVLKKYGIAVSTVSPTVTPDPECSTAQKSGTLWTMGSGYGVKLLWNPTIRTASGCTAPSTNSYTGIQNVYALFPEYAYAKVNGKYSTLEKTADGYAFKSNPNSVGGERIHYIPVYVNDGNYTVSVVATNIWTPAGMITTARNANTVRIKGTLYDDWYQG